VRCILRCNLYVVKCAWNESQAVGKCAHILVERVDSLAILLVFDLVQNTGSNHGVPTQLNRLVKKIAVSETGHS
jgi:hypothetical protein